MNTKTRLIEMIKELRDKIDKEPIKTIEEDILDILLKVDIKGNLKGFKIVFTVGGPTIYLNNDTVVGSWCNENVELSITINAFDEIFYYLNEIKQF